MIRWQSRNPFLALAISNVTFGTMTVYGICLSPNDCGLVVYFGMPFHEVLPASLATG